MSGATVIIVEDDAVYAAALAKSLAAHGHVVVAAFARADDAVATSESADVAIVDLMLPGKLSGADAIHAIRRSRPSIRVLVLSAFIDEPLLDQCIAAGAHGFLFKGTRLKDIALSVADVRDGHTPLSPELARYLVDNARRRAQPATPDCGGLTAREREVLELLARGHAYSSIATALGIGLGTVQNHVKSIYRKLEVSSKAEAVLTAVRTGLVQLED